MIVVFGGHGQLGCELTALAAERSMPLQALSRQQADISDAASVVRALESTRPDVVVNAGAYTMVDDAETHIDEAIRSNEIGPAVLSAVCSEWRVPLVHLSTDYVFDGSKAGAYIESDPVAPVNVYGRTKAAGEVAVREHNRRHVIVRTSWLYGRFGANMLKTIMRLALDRDELHFVADQRGCPTSTLDIARAIFHMVPRIRAGDDIWGTYHFAGAGVTSWYGFANHVVDCQALFTGRRPLVTPIRTAQLKRPAERPQNSELDSGRFVEAFGFRAEPWQVMTNWTIKHLLDSSIKPSARRC